MNRATERMSIDEALDVIARRAGELAHQAVNRDPLALAIGALVEAVPQLRRRVSDLEAALLDAANDVAWAESGG